MIMQPRQNFKWSCQFQYDRDVDVVQYTWHPIVEAGKLVGVGFFYTPCQLSLFYQAKVQSTSNFFEIKCSFIDHILP